MATSFGLGNEPDIIGEDIPSYTQEDVQKAVKGAGYLGTPSYTQEDVQRAVMDAGYLDAPPEFSQQGAIAQLEADLMNDIMIRDQLREEELLGQQNVNAGKDGIKNTIIEGVIQEEGGYSNNPNDKGGATKYGIATNYNKDILNRLGVKDVKNLTLDQAKQIYVEKYWNPSNVDMLPDDVKFDYFTSYINSPKKAVQALQTMAGLKDKDVDGIWGQGTQKSVEALLAKGNLSGAEFKKNYLKKVVKANKGKRSLPEFVNGWFNRYLETNIFGDKSQNLKGKSQNLKGKSEAELLNIIDSWKPNG